MGFKVKLGRLKGVGCGCKGYRVLDWTYCGCGFSPWSGGGEGGGPGSSVGFGSMPVAANQGGEVGGAATAREGLDVETLGGGPRRRWRVVVAWVAWQCPRGYLPRRECALQKGLVPFALFQRFPKLGKAKNVMKKCSI